MKPSTKVEIHLVTWRDTAGYSGWRPRETVEDAAVCINRTVGWLIAEHEDRIILAPSQSDGGLVDDVLSIPAENIIEHEVWT